MRAAAVYVLGLTGALGVAGVARFLSFDASPRRQTAFDLGPADAFVEGSSTRLDAIPALIIRNRGQLVALSLRCTHLGCTVENTPDGFTCPCHGSRYDSEGNVERGPATMPLPRFRLETSSDGRLVLHTD